MSQNYALRVIPHKMFGSLAALEIPGQPTRLFTRNEAAVLSRALTVVEGEQNPEQPIYMSPIASDHDFEAQVCEQGVVLILEGWPHVTLDWARTRALARVLASFSEASDAICQQRRRS